MKRLLVIAIGLLGCGNKPAGDPSSGSGSGSGSAQVAAGSGSGSAGGAGSATSAATGSAVPADPCAKAKPENGMTMPWIADDLPAALACAKQRKVPVMVDLWAPWCHTCLSMQATVFNDASFKPDVDRFVFAALDTDKEVNAAAVARYAPAAWPTFYIIGPDATTGDTETVLARFVGAASLVQFHTFLEAGLKAQQGGAAGADAKLLGAERQLALNNFNAAENDLVAALAQAPATWPRRADVLTSLISTKYKRKDYDGCLEVADKSLNDTGNAAAATDFTVTALSCAEALDKAEHKDPRIKKIRERAVARLTKLLAEKNAPLSVDDRSDAMATLREALDATGKHADAVATAEAQRALLDDAAAKAPTPMAAMTYNWQRCDVYAYLGKPLDLVPALEKSAKDLPDEYDPRARLGWLYLKANKLPEAAKWTDAALGMVYGPRKARLLNQRAEIAAKLHDAAGEKKYRESLVALWQSLPPGQANPEALDKAQQDLAALSDGAAKPAEK